MTSLQNMSVTSGNYPSTAIAGDQSYNSLGCIHWAVPAQQWNGYPSLQYVYTTVTPTECSGDVHVFPCAKCGDCKCGKAKLAKSRR